jgi:hypothetical protein
MSVTFREKLCSRKDIGKSSELESERGHDL